MIWCENCANTVDIRSSIYYVTSTLRYKIQKRSQLDIAKLENEIKKKKNMETIKKINMIRKGLLENYTNVKISISGRFFIL
jgi:hypothetical protein